MRGPLGVGLITALLLCSAMGAVEQEEESFGEFCERRRAECQKMCKDAQDTDMMIFVCMVGACCKA